MLGNHQARQEREVQWGFSHVEVQEPLCRPRRCGTLLGALLTSPRRTPLETTVSRPSCRRTSPSRPGNNSPARGPSASAARCCSARQTPSGWSRRRDVSCCSAGPGARSTALPTTCTDTTVIRFDDAQRHDARRRHARHPPHPDDTHDRTFNVNAGWELKVARTQCSWVVGVSKEIIHLGVGGE